MRKGNCLEGAVARRISKGQAKELNRSSKRSRGMTIYGWKAPYSDHERSRWGISERVQHSDYVAQPRAVEPDSARRIDSVHDLGKAPSTVPAKHLSRMTVRAGDKIVLVSIRDVLWIQSHGNMLWLNLQTARYEYRMTMKDMYRQLDPERFLRVHRNAIVNLDHVVEFDLPRCGNAFVHLRNGKALPISRAARLVLRRGLLSQSYASADADDI